MSTIGNIGEAARNTTGNIASMLNGTMANATAALDAARPVLALNGARDTPILDGLDVSVRGFGDVVQRIGETLRSAGDAVRPAAIIPTVRAASMNSTRAANATRMAAMPATNATMASATAADGDVDMPMMAPSNSTANATATNATASGSDDDDASSQPDGRRRQRSRRAMLLL
jgi:hypothetical protein